MAAIAFTAYRLHVGIDLRDESFSVLVPWRWALGGRPFVDEQNLAQITAYLTYPFIKLFAVVRGGDATGLILYARYLYLGFTLLVAASVATALRGILRWPLAVGVAAVYVTFVYLAIPQLTQNTLGAGLLTIGFALGLRVVIGGAGTRWAVAAGVAHGLAVVAYPTLLFIMPFCAVLLAFSFGHRAVAAIAEGAFAEVPDPDGPPSGRPAGRAAVAYSVGGAAVVAAALLITLSFGYGAIERAWDHQMRVADLAGQLGGAGKAAGEVEGAWRVISGQPVLVAAAILAYVVYRRSPRVGRLLLLALPPALWLAGQHAALDAQGFVIVYGLIAPYLLLFVPRRRRADGARLLIWVWSPAAIAGAMTAYTSASGYLNAPTGLAPAMLVSGVYLAWALEAVVEEGPAGETQARRSGGEWLAFVALAAIVAATIAFQFQYQEGGAARADLTRRMTSGPWKGVYVAPETASRLTSFSSDLARLGGSDDRLLLVGAPCGLYLYWPHGIAANTLRASSRGVTANSNRGEIAYYRRYDVVPTLVARVAEFDQSGAREPSAGSDGLGYPTVLTRSGYSFTRKPADETVQDVLARLPEDR